MTLPLHARRWILAVEGGYVNDPDDPGGETKYGISRRAYPAVNIADLTPDGAAEIYRRDYWEPCQCFELPPELALAVFDAAVNQGRSAAVQVLQLALEWLTGRRLTSDGKIGPETIAAARGAWREHADATLSAYLTFRAQRYVRLVEQRPPAVKFLRGWLLRLFKLQAAALRIGKEVA